jgi:hypothetical protein
MKIQKAGPSHFDSFAPFLHAQAGQNRGRQLTRVPLPSFRKRHQGTGLVIPEPWIRARLDEDKGWIGIRNHGENRLFEPLLDQEV